MLSYAEHGKFRTPIQAPVPFLPFPRERKRKDKETKKALRRLPVATDFYERSALRVDHGTRQRAMPSCARVACRGGKMSALLRPARQASPGWQRLSVEGYNHGVVTAIRATFGEMNFASDNTAGVAPAMLEAIAAANRGYARGYGNDEWTQDAQRRLSEVFERDVAAFLVPTGTAANALALAQLSPPWGVVFCHAESHIATDECGAPEFFGGGLKLVGLPGGDGKIAADTLTAALAGYGGHSPHQMVPSVLSITQASEAGTIYRTGEIETLSAIAHERSLAVHMDGARFANALVRLNATPAQMTWQSGVDVLSFGATKGGALAAEAVVIFDPARAAYFGERRKRGGHLLSKHRFIAAQFLAYLAEDRWLALARHANAMADRLAAKLATVGLKPVWPVEANLIFVILPRALDAKLRAAGANYYVRSSDGLDVGTDNVLVRLVTSFATEDEDIDRFVGQCKKS
jgi:threonine aldolase